MAGDVEVQPYRPVLDPQAVRLLRARLADSRVSAVDGDWRQGVPAGWLRELLDDWRRFDPDALQARLDAMTHVRADIRRPGRACGGLRGRRGRAAVPLVLTHGWPGSFLEHTLVAPLLSDAFTVVIPSLPGFGFSGPPPVEGLTSRAVAATVAPVDDRRPGSRQLRRPRQRPRSRNHRLARPRSPRHGPGRSISPPQGSSPAPEPRTPEERAFAARSSPGPPTRAATRTNMRRNRRRWAPRCWTARQAWPPGSGRRSCPGAAPGSDGAPAFDRELLLATLTLYWITGTITSSLLPYWVTRHNSGGMLPVDDPSPVATAVSTFGGERVPFPKPPRALAERYFTVSQWREHDTGGHFPTVAEPELLARILRDAFGPAAQAAAPVADQRR